MVGLDTLDAHVVFHDLAGDHDGFYFLEAEQREEALCGGDIAHDNGDVIEVRTMAFLFSGAEIGARAGAGRIDLLRLC